MYYEDYIICYLDVLGFSNLVNESVKSEGADKEFLEKYLSIDTFFKSALDKSLEKDGIKIQIISDSIILTCAISSNDIRPCFVDKIKKVAVTAARIQYLLAKSNMWLRGAMTSGKLYVNGHHIIGPALIKAYRLESDFTLYPRVIFDLEVVRDIFETMECFKRELKESEDYFGWKGYPFISRNDFIGTDTENNFDNIPFIDFLEASFLDSFCTEEQEVHLKSVLNYNRENCLSRPDISAKHAWVNNYFKGKILSESFKDKELQASLRVDIMKDLY